MNRAPAKASVGLVVATMLSGNVYELRYRLFLWSTVIDLACSSFLTNMTTKKQRGVTVRRRSRNYYYYYYYYHSAVNNDTNIKLQCYLSIFGSIKRVLMRQRG